MSEPGVFRSGPETETGKVLFGLYLIFCGFVVLICIALIRGAEKMEKKNSFPIKCPSCRREKEISEYGRYKCTKCGQKFIIGSDGKISKI